MIADLNHLVRLRKSQVKPASEVFARAFQDDPPLVHFLPDTSQRKNVLPYIFELAIRYGVSYGEVYATSSSLEGVAVWLPAETANMSLWGMIRCGGLSLIPRMGRVMGKLQRFNEYTNLMRQRHTPFRHWFLQTIGVDPVFQGKGYADILLKAMLARMDQEHLPCYLDTQNGENVPIYQHYGFKVIEQVVIPSTGISHWAMLREGPG